LCFDGKTFVDFLSNQFRDYTKKRAGLNTKKALNNAYFSKQTLVMSRKI
jgi:hypothetical protein